MSSGFHAETAESQCHFRLPPPSYRASVALSDSALNNIVSLRYLDDDHNAADSDSDSHQPPPFAHTPGALVIEHGSLFIHSPISGARPLYELSTSLDDKHPPSAVCLMSVSPLRAALDYGARFAKAVPEEDKLYDISKAGMTSSTPSTPTFHGTMTKKNHHTHPAQVVIHSRHSNQFGVLCLRKEHHLSLSDHKRTSYDAIVFNDSNHPRVIYQAFPGKKHGTVEWRDGGGMLVAVDSWDMQQERGEKTLTILISMDKRRLDLMVALWMGRILEDAQEKAEKVELQEIKELRRRTGDDSDKGSGLLHSLRESFHHSH